MRVRIKCIQLSLTLPQASQASTSGIFTLAFGQYLNCEGLKTNRVRHDSLKMRSKWVIHEHEQRDQMFPFVSPFTPLHLHSLSRTLAADFLLPKRINKCTEMFVADIMALTVGLSFVLHTALCTIVVDFAFSFLNSNRDCCAAVPSRKQAKRELSSSAFGTSKHKHSNELQRHSGQF